MALIEVDLLERVYCTIDNTNIFRGFFLVAVLVFIVYKNGKNIKCSSAVCGSLTVRTIQSEYYSRSCDVTNMSWYLFLCWPECLKNTIEKLFRRKEKRVFCGDFSKTIIDSSSKRGCSVSITVIVFSLIALVFLYGIKRRNNSICSPTVYDSWPFKQ